MYDYTHKAIGKRLDDRWDKSTVLLGENLPAGKNPPWNGSTPWIRWSIREADNFSADVGGTFQRETGVVVFQVFVPEEGGTRKAKEVGRKLALIFNEATFAAEDGTALKFERLRVTFSGNSGGWFQQNYTVAYQGDGAAINADQDPVTVAPPVRLPSFAIIDLYQVTALTGGTAADLDGVDVDAYGIGVGRTASVTVDGTQKFVRLIAEAPGPEDWAVKNHPELAWRQTGGL